MITILSSPKPFEGAARFNQLNAIRSWKALAPDVEVILYGDSRGTEIAVGELGATWVPDVEASETGIPLFGAIAAHAAAHAAHDVQAYVNCDIILTPTFLDAVRRVGPPRFLLSGFLLSGARLDLAEGVVVDTAEPGWLERIPALADDGRLRLPAGGADFFVFPRGLWASLPRIVVGRAAYENALFSFALRRRVPVIDATPDVVSLHPFHDYSHAPGGRQAVFGGAEAQTNLRACGHLFATVGDADWQMRGGVLRRAWNRGDWLGAAEVYARAALNSRPAGGLLRLARAGAHRVGLSRSGGIPLAQTLSALDGACAGLGTDARRAAG